MSFPATELHCAVCDLAERDIGQPRYATVYVLDGFSLCHYCGTKVRDRWLRDRTRKFGDVVTELLRELLPEVTR